MLEGLWSIEFISNLNVIGTGVVVFESERLFGGDSGYFYVGSYSSIQGVVTGEAEVTHYAGPSNSIFGNVHQFRVQLSGKVTRPTMELSGSVVGMPALQLGVRCTHRADLLLISIRY